jgi:hypothetical protein
MITTIIVVCTILVLLALLWQLARASATGNDPVRSWETRGRKVNLDAFRLLVDPTQGNYLWRSVPKAQFRKLQRKRITLALRFVRTMDSNAALLLSVATGARQAEDQSIVSAADRLMYLAYEVRINALVAEFCLALRWILPSSTISVPMSVERYQRLLENCDWILSRQHPPQNIQMAG